MYLPGLIEREIAPNLRVAKRMVEELAPEVWDVLEEVVKNRPVSSKPCTNIASFGYSSILSYFG